MLPWLAGLAVRFFKFALYTLGAVRVFSWLYGFDAEAQAWTSQNRILITIFLFIVLIAYAMYAWLDHREEKE